MYVFSEANRYLGIRQKTDADGVAAFTLPAGTYSFRADYQGNRFWSDDAQIIAHQDNEIPISTGGGTFTLTLKDQNDTPFENITTHLYSESGKYLRERKNTDSQGQVAYDLADGSYKVRIDYLGYQYWTEIFTVPDTTSLEHVIDHQEVSISVVSSYNGDSLRISGVKVYLFTSSGQYQSLSELTDESGQVKFNLPANEYKVRVDSMGQQYWSDPFTQTNTDVVISDGLIEITLDSHGNHPADVPIYVFNQADKYHGIKGYTSENGTVLFRLPVGHYKFMANYQASKFWAVSEVVADQQQDVVLTTGGGIVTLLVLADQSTSLVGAKCYLFNDSGKYLRQSAITDDQGQVSFDVADGSYKIRVDYLKAQFWSDVFVAPDQLTGTLTIEHQDVTITVNKDWGSTKDPIGNVKCYLFTASGKYTGLSSVSDDQGQVHFSIPLQNYKVRADHLKQQFWSDEFDWYNSEINIGYGTINAHVTESGSDVEGARVYLFTETGKYLGLNKTTDSSGLANFEVPASSYKLRVDINGNQYWSDVMNIIEHQVNDVGLLLDDLAAAVTNDPNPIRIDGEGPLYTPMLASLGSYMGLISQVIVGDIPTTEGQLFYYSSDHLGTAQMITDEQAQVVWQGDYSPFGKVDVIVDQLENRFRYPGQVVDNESGLFYNWHRFYDPETGRYISADPIGLDGGINLYAYANQNPISFIDPMGLECILKIDSDYRDKTGVVKTFTSDDPSNPVHDFICSHPSAICWDSRYEYKEKKEQWAIYEAVIEVCTDECGRFLSRKVLSKTKKADSEYWITLEMLRRKKFYFNGFKEPDSVGINNDWERM